MLPIWWTETKEKVTCDSPLTSVALTRMPPKRQSSRDHLDRPSQIYCRKILYPRSQNLSVWMNCFVLNKNLFCRIFVLLFRATFHWNIWNIVMNKFPWLSYDKKQLFSLPNRLLISQGSAISRHRSITSALVYHMGVLFTS